MTDPGRREVDRNHADGTPRRLAECAERNPSNDETHQSCCRFPKTCSPYPYDETPVTEDDLEPRREALAPPSADPGRSGGEGTGLVGWHRHDITGTVHQARACFVDDAHPVIVLDPVTARDTIARALGGHKWMGLYRWSRSQKCYLYECSCGEEVPSMREHIPNAIAAALASQERGE